MTSRLPKPKLTVFSISCKKILMRMNGQTVDFFAVNLKKVKKEGKMVRGRVKLERERERERERGRERKREREREREKPSRKRPTARQETYSRLVLPCQTCTLSQINQSATARQSLLPP